MPDLKFERSVLSLESSSEVSVRLMLCNQMNLSCMNDMIIEFNNNVVSHC